jgi:hypothetical protein
MPGGSSSRTDFRYFIRSRPALGFIQPPILSFRRVKRREADHSPPRAAVKNGGIMPPLPSRLHGVVLN